MPDLIVALSYFDRKIGPTVYMEYPERVGEEEKMTLNQIFDQTTSEGWFWHSLNTKDYATSLNYYFEIKSDWARGLKEMLMCSILFKEKLNSEKEHEVLSWLTDFVMKMHGRPDLFKAFYPASKQTPGGVEAPTTSESDTELNQSYVVVLKWLKELYYSTREEIRQKSEEEIIANLMVNPAIFQTIRKLSKHPVRMSTLHAWFNEQQFNRDFEKIISMLEEHKFIVINKIGLETYAILVKSIDIFRIPPSCVLEFIDQKELPPAVTEHYISIVSDYFNRYQQRKGKQDPAMDEVEKLKLFSAMSMPKHYNLIAELRKKPVAKSQIGAILRQGPVVATKINVLEDLKADDIIDEYEHEGMTYVMLKTDINIVDQFPEYIQNALPENEKIAKIPRHYALPPVPPDVQDDLKNMFTREGFMIDQVEVQAKPGTGAGTGPNQEPGSIPSSVTPDLPPVPGAIDSAVAGTAGIDDSPFDDIVDKMTTKFITSHPVDADGGSTAPDGTRRTNKT
ncbi:MAG: hypothetical protein GYA24_13645 [Candidatus Lokiarchaeota archaeon]|nr:hypothetical protein [Candidatus Lokiarchaeota archaeon]